MIPNQAWPKEREDLLRECIENRMSAGDTGELLGISRNACMGKANRMGLKFKSVTGHKPGKPRAKRAAQDRRFMPNFQSKTTEAPAMVPLVEVEPLNLTIHELTDDPRQPTRCRWPYGDGVETVYCGHQTDNHSPWCPGHKIQATSR